MFNASTRVAAEPPPLNELLAPPTVEPTISEATAVLAQPPQQYVAVPEQATEEPATPEPTPTPIPPLRVYGISSDDGGVSAAAATPPPPPPIRIGGISFDDAPSTETVTAEPSAEATPTPDATAAPE